MRTHNRRIDSLEHRNAIKAVFMALALLAWLWVFASLTGSQSLTYLVQVGGIFTLVSGVLFFIAKRK